MDPKKRKRLEDAGWVFGDAGDFLGLSQAEIRLIDLKIALSVALREKRTERGTTQAGLAKAMGSSQSRVAKMERGDPEVSVDLLLKALMALGLSNRQIARIIG